MRRAQVEQDFRWAETTSVMLIGGAADWSALERCEANASGPVVYQGFDPRNPSETITCRRNLAPLVDELRAYVAATSQTDPSCNGGRVGLINLAPTFSGESRLPRYLEDARFNGASPVSGKDVLASFRDLWDAVLLELQDARYVSDLDPQDRAFFYISLGNEVDMYLNARRAPYPPAEDEPGPCGPNEPNASDCYLPPATRWVDYATFYVAAANYVRQTAAAAGVPVSVGATFRWGREHPAPDYSGDGVCGPRELYVSYLYGQPCRYLGVPGVPDPATGLAWSTVYPDELGAILAYAYAPITQASDVHIFTRYFPQFNGAPPGTDLSTVSFTMRAALDEHFANMGDWSALLTDLGATTFDLRTVIQEISWPSSHRSGLHNSQDLADQQQLLIEHSFGAWNAYNDVVAPAANTAPIASLNWFALHDFHPSSCEPTNPLGLPFEGCEWGLYQPDHSHKYGTSLAPNANYFHFRGAGQNPGTDPQRCN